MQRAVEAGPRAAAAGRDGGRGDGRVRGGEGALRACSTSRTCCWSPRRPSRSTGTSPRSCGPATGTSWSTSTRTSARCSSGCWTPGWAAATTSAWSATPTRRSTPSPARPRRTCWTSRAASPARPWSGWCATTGRRRRWSSWPTGCSAGGRRCGWSGSGRRGRSRLSPSTTTSRPRRRRWPSSCRAQMDAGVPASELAVLFRVNAQSEAYERALSEAGGAVRAARRGAVLRPDGDPGGGAAAARRGPVRRVGGEAGGHRPGRAVRAGAGRPPLRRAAAPRGSGGSRWPRWSPSPRSWPPCSPRRGWATSSPSWSSGPPRSTRRPCRA